MTAPAFSKNIAANTRLAQRRGSTGDRDSRRMCSYPGEAHVSAVSSASTFAAWRVGASSRYGLALRPPVYRPLVEVKQ